MRLVGIPTGTAVCAVLTTRLMAFVSLLMVIATGLPIAVGFQLEFRDQILLGSAFVAGIGLLVGILVLDSIRERVPILQCSIFIAKITQVSKDLGGALTSKGHTRLSLLFSTLTHLLRVSIFASIAGALHANVGFAALYALIPIALLVDMVPITLGGWGIREISLVFFLGWVSVPVSVALSISITFGLLRLVMAAIGGIVWLFTRSHHYELQVADISD